MKEYSSSQFSRSRRRETLGTYANARNLSRTNLRSVPRLPRQAASRAAATGDHNDNPGDPTGPPEEALPIVSQDIAELLN